MENPFLATTKLHPTSLRNRLLTLGVSSKGHRSLSFCRQRNYHHQHNSVGLVCGSFVQKRINTSGRQRTANSCKNPASRNVRVELGSRSDNEADASLAIETRRNAVWGIFHNFRWKLMSSMLSFCASFSLAGSLVLLTTGFDFQQIPSDVFKADELGKEIAFIALPAVLALAADPLASLVDTAFIGKIGTAVMQRCVILLGTDCHQRCLLQGPVELAAVGVSISVFNLISKIFNVPLLNITTSFVAEDASEGLPDISSESLRSTSNSLLLPNNQDADPSTEVSVSKKEEEKVFLPAVSSALVLGTALGVGQACVLTLLAGPVLTVMGVGASSAMRTPAVEYLALRGLGAPAVVISLAVQGAFRGFKDTQTPLYVSVAGNIVNIVLDPILMFSFNFGVGGAAVATVISQYVIAGLLMWKLNQRVLLFPQNFGDMDLSRFMTSGGLLLGRTVALLSVMTLATSMAARQGVIPMAAHQISMQIWLAASLLTDAIALAGQSIIAGAFAKNDYKVAKKAAIRVLQIGGSVGIFLAVLLGFGMPAFSRLFTQDDSVLVVMQLLLPFVALTQPLNAFAFVFDGLHYGASDFVYAAVTMMLLTVPSTLVLVFLPKYWGLSAVWAGLTAIMGLRTAAGFWRLGSATGPWSFLKQEADEIKT